MTKVVVEVELDLETHYRPGRSAQLTPFPGHPEEPDEVEVVSLDSLVVEGQKIQLPNDTASDLLDELMAHKGLRTRIEELIRDEAIRHG